VRTDDFDYDLPRSLIAQHPAQPRDSSRLLVLDRERQAIEHAVFRDLPRFLRPGDALVLNETRVLRARLAARKQPGGGKVELLLLRRLEPQCWEALVGGRGMRLGARVAVDGGPTATVESVGAGGLRRIRFDGPISPLIDAIGSVPLPPYIHEPLRDPSEYQTVYARRDGSAAAPTAGLHFTPELLAALEAAGVSLVRIVLHVGLDTFAPVEEADPSRHVIHREYCEIGHEAVEAIHRARLGGGRVVAVGTTSVRTLETAARAAPPGSVVAPFSGETDLLILPGHTFRAVDALLTNFHLPRTTLLMLVSAFAGREQIRAAYAAAIAEGYRFYSFGDAMLIL
jgi:S-adenosylmethionine:tRNA ribosyltransferase-isomerase